MPQIGEAFAGSGPEAAHVNTVLGRKGSPVETAWATALATPRAGYIPFVVVVRPNLPVKPATLFVNKADIKGDQHAALTWGAAQAGVARGVLGAVADGIVPRDDFSVGEHEDRPGFVQRQNGIGVAGVEPFGPQPVDFLGRTYRHR